MSSDVSRGRDAFERSEWSSAHEALSSAHRAGTLEVSDLEKLAVAAYLIGNEDEFVQVLEEAHHTHLGGGDPLAACRCAFWLGLHLANRGEIARASGWFGRAGRLIEREEADHVERGYLLIPVGHQQFESGDLDASARTAARAATIGQRFGDADLLALALHLQGRALLRQGRIDEGLALLDEAMISVSTGELLPQVTGLVYCSVIGACREVFAMRRAHEWTAALSEWCERQPDMVAYGGECRVYRAEIMQRRGAWADALAEARRATDLLAGRAGPGPMGLALYQQGEVHRLRGEVAAAEDAYHAASRCGRAPQPGLALLRLAQGEHRAAAAAIRRALAEAPDDLPRARLLPACVEIMLELGELEEAREACEELAAIAGRCAPGVLEVVVDQARAAIELAAGDARAALAGLREACRRWQALGARYEAARAHMLLGKACRELGDEEGARMELSAARAELEELGAAPDLARVEALLERPVRRRVHGLTPRELEVLALVATGRTNRAIAETLFISEKTVARHVANIFGKLGVSTRAAATAFAYEHGLARPPT